LWYIIDEIKTKSMIFEKMNLLIQIFGQIFQYIGLGIVILAGLIAIYRFVIQHVSADLIRHKFARKVMFGLEFVIAADIMLVTVALDLNDLIRLGGVVIIRVILGYALSKEVKDTPSLNKK